MRVMALSSNDMIKWQDIKDIYNSLNTARTKFSMGTVTVPEEVGSKALPSHLITLKDLVSAMSSNGYIGDAASTSAVPVPTAGNLVEYGGFTKLDTIIEDITDICPHNPFTANFSGFSDNGASFLFGASFRFSSNYSGFSDNGASFLYGANFSSFSNNSWCHSQCSGGGFTFTGSF